MRSGLAPNGTRMLRIFLFYGLVALVLALAFRRGDWETRFAAVICLVASLLSLRLMAFDQPVEFGVAMVDLGVLAAFVTIALRTERFWPLWVSGLQLTTFSAHALRMIEPDLVNFAYAAAMRFWSYPILAIVAIAALRSERYRLMDKDGRRRV